MVMGRNGYGPILSWAEMVMGRNDQLPFLTLYKSLVCSIIHHGGSVYFPITKKNIQLIENIQRHATKLLPEKVELKDLTYSERLEGLNLPMLHYRRKRYDLIQLYKIVHGFEDIEPGKFVEFNDNCTKGHLFKIQKPSCRKKLRMNAFPVRCINMWSSLTEETVTSDTVLKFKTRLDRHLQPDRFNLAEIY